MEFIGPQLRKWFINIRKLFPKNLVKIGQREHVPWGEWTLNECWKECICSTRWNERQVERHGHSKHITCSSLNFILITVFRLSFLKVIQFTSEVHKSIISREIFWGSSSTFSDTRILPVSRTFCFSSLLIVRLLLYVWLY